MCSLPAGRWAEYFVVVGGGAATGAVAGCCSILMSSLSGDANNSQSISVSSDRCVSVPAIVIIPPRTDCNTTTPGSESELPGPGQRALVASYGKIIPLGNAPPSDCEAQLVACQVYSGCYNDISTSPWTSPRQTRHTSASKSPPCHMWILAGLVYFYPVPNACTGWPRASSRAGPSIAMVTG